MLSRVSAVVCPLRLQHVQAQLAHCCSLADNVVAKQDALVARDGMEEKCSGAVPDAQCSITGGIVRALHTKTSVRVCMCVLTVKRARVLDIRMCREYVRLSNNCCGKWDEIYWTVVSMG